MSYSIEQHQGITHVRFDSYASVEEIDDASEQLSQMRNAEKRLWLFEEGVDLSAQDVRSIADRANGRDFPRSWVAIVANKNIAYGLSRMYAVFRTVDNITVKVFTNEGEALTWLHDPRGD